MELYFLRHGDYAKKTGLKDAECPLSEQGAALMEREASFIARLGVRPDLVLTSPLLRARQTAEIMARGLGLSSAPVVDARLGPGFGSKALGDILLERRDSAVLMLVGHAPDMSDAIGACIGGSGVEMKKGSLARVDIGNPRSPSGALVWLLPPQVFVP
jgi:phosphohistidine phosphatase